MGVGSKPVVDQSGRPIQRYAATMKGWHYQALFFEYKTSDGSIYCKDESGGDLSSNYSILRYDSNDNPTTTKADVVKDVITWKPSYDYEIISGKLYQASKPASDLRVFVTGGMYDENNNNAAMSVKDFVTGGMNLKYIDKPETDGRASKFMKKDTEGASFDTNRFQWTITHPAGLEHEVLIGLEIFKA